jgi:Dickkopf N-terminal cysteine-rich region
MHFSRFVSAPVLLACVWLAVVLPACKEGEVDFDASVFDDEDASTQKKDASVADEDAGLEHDAGGHDASQTPDAGGEVLTAEMVPAALAAAVCEGLTACRGEELLADYLKGESCVDLYTARQEDGELRFLPDSIEAGRVVFSPASFEACAEDLAALGCDVQTHRLPASCEQAFAGQVAEGGDCDIDLDCGGAAFCDKGMLETCPGTCAALQANGLPCAASHECADGLVCFGGWCTAAGDEGDDCAAGMTPCGVGFACRTEGADKLCRSLASVYSADEGDACGPTASLCAGDLVCASTSASAGTCEPRVASGAACRRAQPNQCPRDEYCDADPGMEGTCTAFPVAEEPCLVGRSQVCAAGFVCIADVCQAIGRAGDVCTEDSQCYSGTCLDSGAGNTICVTPLMCDL